jgi:hypothetical protein
VPQVWVSCYPRNFHFKSLDYKNLSGRNCTTALILFIHIGFLEYLSFKQFKLIVIYYTTRGLKILDYTRRVARKHHETVDRVVFPAPRRVIENFPSSKSIKLQVSVKYFVKLIYKLPCCHIDHSSIFRMREMFFCMVFKNRKYL